MVVWSGGETTETRPWERNKMSWTTNHRGGFTTKNLKRKLVSPPGMELHTLKDKADLTVSCGAPFSVCHILYFIFMGAEDSPWAGGGILASD